MKTSTQPHERWRNAISLWVMTNTPSSYQVEFFNAVHANGAFNLDLRFMRLAHRGAEWTTGPRPQFKFRLMRGIGPSLWSDAFRIHPSAIWDACRLKADFFLLTGQYTSVTFVLVAAILAARRAKWGAWLERPWPDDYRANWSDRVSPKTSFGALLRRTVLKYLLARASILFCIGTKALNSYTAMGIPARVCRNFPYRCDTRRFDAVSRGTVEELRRKLGAIGKVVFLFSGQLIERKGVDVLIRAFASIPDAKESCILLILGDGAMKEALRQMVPPELSQSVIFSGHVPYDEVPCYFRASDVFAFPSRYDGWAVVINEACSAGLPIIVTKATGAADDMVLDGVNGYVTNVDSVVDFAENMKQLAVSAKLRMEMGARSRQMALKADATLGAEELRAYILTTIEGK